MKGQRHIDLLVGRRQRVAFRFDAAIVRQHLPAGVVGSYLLLDGRVPVYVGRSDSCLRRRLKNHPLLGRASHVTWEPTSSLGRAFMLEAFWFHELHGEPSLLNIAHPARPAGSTWRCPYCPSTATERHALRRALRPPPSPCLVGA